MQLMDCCPPYMIFAGLPGDDTSRVSTSRTLMTVEPNSQIEDAEHVRVSFIRGKLQGCEAARTRRREKHQRKCKKIPSLTGIQDIIIRRQTIIEI